MMLTYGELKFAFLTSVSSVRSITPAIKVSSTHLPVDKGLSYSFLRATACIVHCNKVSKPVKGKYLLLKTCYA